jgi:hypothetical protein
MKNTKKYLFFICFAIYCLHFIILLPIAMSLLSPAITRLIKMRIWSIEQWLENPIDTQRNLLLHIVNQGEYTQYGKQYNFENIHNYSDFVAKVPLQHYENFSPYIESMLAGEENILWNTPIKWYAKSSGTTSAKSKFIPLSDESIENNHFLASKDVLTFYYLNNPDSNLLDGKNLIIGGSLKISEVNENASVGDLSAILMQNSPFWVDWVRTPDLNTLLMEDWEEKMNKLVETTITENVTSISGVPTWTLMLLRRILLKTQAQNISQVWPNLELYMTGGVSFVPYKKEFELLVGKPIKYLDMYNASEGFFAAQTSDKEDGLTLMIGHGIFYEFITMDSFHSANPIIVSLATVTLNTNYAIVITTLSGLYRYIVGDTVQFTNINPYRIKITGRTKHFINAFGEELIIDNADDAIAKAAENTQCIITDYTAAPIYFEGNNKAAHEWIIAFEKMPNNIQEFAIALDNALKNNNSDYEAKRQKDIALTLPKIVPVLPKLFTQWLQSKGKLGGQHKVPRLSNDRNIINEIKQLGNL